MRILYIVDGRSPIALNWIRYFCEKEHEVHLVSTHPCRPDLHLASLHVIPAAFANSTGEQGIQDNLKGLAGFARRLLPVGIRTGLRQWLGPLTLPAAARQLSDLIDQIQPDLIHAMRIPYEGMLAALATGADVRAASGGYTGPGSGARVGLPLLISVWGNDFTLHARATPRMASLTRMALRHASALHADCQRDIRLAREWGFSPDKPVVELPGGGGVQLDIFYPTDDLAKVHEPSQGHRFVINPRGFRAYVHNDAFFQAIPLVLEKLPDVCFICPAMANELVAERWIEKLAISQAVELLPVQTRPQIAELFRRSMVAVSPTTHDGTPNTLLEAMACGCFPVAGDIESLQEWITPGVNGLLVDPRNPRLLADAILQALSDPDLHLKAMRINTRLVAERAEYRRVMGEAEGFYRRLISQ
jgi:glycosyltransferase involved in cell wall biosynthesis